MIADGDLAPDAKEASFGPHFGPTIRCALYIRPELLATYLDRELLAHLVIGAGELRKLDDHYAMDCTS